MARSLTSRRPYITLGNPPRVRIGRARVTLRALIGEALAIVAAGSLIGMVLGCMIFGVFQ